MKFAEHLSAHITPEWRKQYISYEEMKAMLYTAVEEAPSAESVEPEVISRHFASFDEVFFTFCDRELKKINTFYSEKLAEATRKYAALQSELKTALEQQGSGKNKGKINTKPLLPTRKLRELKLAFSEFYLSLILLQNYQNLNHTGFRKILKKHDKLLSVDAGSKWRVECVEISHFYTSKDIDKLIQETETTVTNDLEGGDRQRAMKRLRVPPLGEHQSPWTTFKVGLFSGSFIVLAVAVVLSAIFHDGGENLKIAFRLYRGPLLIIEFLFLIGVNVYGWRSSGVNHVLIFELDPRNHLSEQHLMELAAVLGVIWTLSLLSFLYSASLSIPPYVNPLVLVCIMVVFLINPLKIFRHEARLWLLKIIIRVVISPFAYVNFADFWLADQFNSLATAFVDLYFLICFYIMNGDWHMQHDSTECTSGTCSIIIRSFVNCLPAWFRFAQCVRRYRDSKEAFPHLVNAGKYATTFLVVVTNTLSNYYAASYTSRWENGWLWSWLFSCLLNSIYSYTWDLKMDWGLLDKKAVENRFLREEMVYSAAGFYYFAIIEDFILRFIWIVSFILVEWKYVSSDLMTSIVAPLEVFRRFVWNFFRLENEHLNNCGKFRAVRDISIAPIESSDQTQILRMMDEEDGVTNRGKRKGGGKKQGNTKEERRMLLKDETVDLEVSNVSLM
ncbi:xenotropic and polytropic retrovirus receptor 1 [Harpegnathos saltator]|uniref:xenotropic and polytropic retrovirus receptor 1 n=1 Tax=Harpegnathos saltator TaxID=610380 RepID=UPI00058D9869|nr:xenotropic and polytropic retrovirus receptor 1 [Harpegnathos saltator]XP_011137540.1 xenotropic and polytropic retrovirus receptor 1 [Harpegnathos saltator]XP_011137542.1 xenotropic and polytropic retrovirus receptor 1 [Harpegnathos saltator]XP_011137543.1 xenotropic and polytropic retrovirus receptor 1 [Harpegnathos saltator]XP_011137544.1 xenotropic and polytropic retrovirus receptor 1 [Harpegnathos saltator]XP_019696448.1 xenotropic and polytropic retrovirus receptor 1 [Harpegnathos sal